MNTPKEISEAMTYLDKLIIFGEKINLDNITIILNQFSNPQKLVPAIHIAGTNGKGSVSCMLTNALIENKLKVGLFTSPFLVHFSERWRINDRAISEDELAFYILKIKKAKLDIIPTYFEALTVIAFLWFSDQKIDIAILEAGMGGRLDATNICQPLLCVITNIALDHTQYLGTSIKQISSEKAGIIKQNIPLILGDISSEARTVILQKAKAKNSSVIDSKKLNFKDKVNPPFSGNHQIKNLKTTLAIIKYLSKNNLIKQKKLAYKGIEKSYWAGRLDYITPNLILDGAHNPEAVLVLTKELKQNNFHKKWHIFFATMKDKDWQKSIDLLLPFAKYWSLISLDIMRSEKPEKIALYLKQKNQQFHIKKIKDFKANSNENTLIVGSLYLVGEVLAVLYGKIPMPITKKEKNKLKLL